MDRCTVMVNGWIQGSLPARAAVVGVAAVGDGDGDGGDGDGDGVWIWYSLPSLRPPFLSSSSS